MLIAPLSRLIIHDHTLDGSQGLNRAPANPSEPVVNSDIDAAVEFLNRHRATPTTQRNYTNQVERLILWSINVKQKPMSSLSFIDMEEFVEFLANPQPMEEWATQRKHPRADDAWKPFTIRVVPSARKDGEATRMAGLAASSRLTAMASLESFLGWLVDYGYLLKNPMRQIKTTRKAVRTETPKSTTNVKVERYLDEDMWAAFQEAIESLPKESKVEQDHYERSKFISALMLFLAPRANELAIGRMNDFRSEGTLWWWHVVGKGRKAEKIPVVEDMLKALIRYRRHHNLSPLPLDSDTSPLLRSVKDGMEGNAITARQLNYILDSLFESAAKILEVKSVNLPSGDILGRAAYQTKANKIRTASSHWGRHTAITYMSRSGIPKDIVQRNARHSDSKTTDAYTHEDEEYWHQESQKLHAD